jgi:hypothetical protein
MLDKAIQWQAHGIGIVSRTLGCLVNWLCVLHSMDYRSIVSELETRSSSQP